MSDVAQLGLSVDSSQAKSAAVDLDKLTVSAKGAQDAEAGLASTSKTAGAGLSSLAAGARDAASAHTAGATAVRLEKEALAAHTAQTGLNRIQMLELTHVGRELTTMFAQGVDPIRALTLESGRIATLFSMGNGGIGGTFKALLPILGPIAAALAVVGVGVAALTTKLNAGKPVALSFFDTLKGIGVTAWGAVKAQFDSAPTWMSAAWDKLGTISGDAINNIIQQLAILAVQINTAFKNLPDDVMLGIENTGNTVIDWLNRLTDGVNGLGRALARLSGQNVAEPSPAEIAATHIGSLDFAGGAANDEAANNDAMNKKIAGIMGTNYLPLIYKNGLPGDDGKGKSDPYAKAIESAKEATAALNAQAAALGKTAEQTAYLEEQTKLLNEATQKGATLSPSQIKMIDEQAKSYAIAKANLQALTQLYDLGKSTTEDFFSTFKSDLTTGESLWQSFGDAASKVLDDISNKALQMAADGIWDMIFNGISSGASGGSSGGSGGLLGSLLQLFGGAGHNAGGTDNWRGGLTWVSEQGPELVNLPAGAGVTPAPQSAALLGRAANGAANGNMPPINITNHITAGSAADAAEIARVTTQTMRMQLPGAIAEYNRNPSRRGN